MRLCYGTFATVLKRCALNGVTQLDIHDALLLTLDPKDSLGLSRDNTQATRWFNCQTNLNPKLIKAMEYAKPERLAEDFREIVMGLIDPNRIIAASLAMRAIIEKDEGIISRTVVDLINNISKAELLNGPVLISYEFFAGIFLYAVSVGRNREGQSCISEINEPFIETFIAESVNMSANAHLKTAVNTIESTALDSNKIPSDNMDHVVLPDNNSHVKYREEYILLPIYLVLDTSYSMQEDNKFNTALSFLPKLLSVMTESSSLSDKIRVGIITFDENVRIHLPLGGINEIEEWIVKNKKKPIIADGHYTYYGRAFNKLKSEIQADVCRIKSKTLDSVSYNAYRPVVIFITDAAPNDDLFERNRAFELLTDKNFEYRPNIICVGVGDVTHDDLVEYGAGRYNSPTGLYITRNEKLIITPIDGVLPSQALKSIVSALVTTIVQSISNASNMIGSGGIPDLFESQNDLKINTIEWSSDE